MSPLRPQTIVAPNVCGQKVPNSACREKWQRRSAAVWRESRFGGKKRSEPEEGTERESKELYRKALSEAAQIAGFSVSQGFEDSRQRTWYEFGEFLGSIGHGLTTEEASDLDVIAFVQGYWLPTHREKCRTWVDGEKIASASAVKGVIQQLGKSFSMLGRSDQENPAKQESVRNYCEGYRKWLKSKGVREKRAKVFKEGKVGDLINFMERQISQAVGLRKCILMMDLAAIDYLWESWARGKECGELRKDEIDFEEGVAKPGWSKTVHQEQSATINLVGPGRGRFLESSVALVREMERCGHPVGVGPLFRPLNRSRDGFADTPLSAGALRKRLQQHLKDAGLFDEETLHSFRRSAVQGAAEIEGYDVPKLMALGRWKSYAAFRIYIEEIESEFPRLQ
jgi:integrase